MYIVYWVILSTIYFIETVQEILEDKQKDDVKLRTKLEVQEITINEKTMETDDLKSILEEKEGTLQVIYHKLYSILVELHLLKQTLEQQQVEIKELKSILQEKEGM